jgi:hypothetical protein
MLDERVAAATAELEHGHADAAVAAAIEHPELGPDRPADLASRSGH